MSTKKTAHTPEWYYRNRAALGKKAAEVIESGKKIAIPENVARARLAHKQSQSVTIRLAVSDLELAKEQAERKGLPYQTYLKSVLHQALEAAR